MCLSALVESFALYIYVHGMEGGDLMCIVAILSFALYCFCHAGHDGVLFAGDGRFSAWTLKIMLPAQDDHDRHARGRFSACWRSNLTFYICMKNHLCGDLLW